PTRRSSDLRSVDAARSPAEPSAAPSPALSRPTTAPRRQNATATDAGPLSAAAPSPPPSLHALAPGGQQEANRIITQWLGPIGMPDHTHKPFDISRKPTFTAR